ncbi:hypothetical protein RvY_00343 [Ramazzottius varieornatus]|uniref:Anion exchange protein n=1 Tax=Ramazzottius varieornatus TaxID=947166 RepID=A0A1D1UDE3_RAMVA|nr:hypothetical protein RvY_00343 [Ramazzottius varieornatus]
MASAPANNRSSARNRRNRDSAQFTLGDGEEVAEERANIPVVTHPLFCEMEELRRAKSDGTLEWKETARWIKFEEDVEEGGNRWSKPFVATLPLPSLLDLRTHIGQAAILLDVEVPALAPLCDLVIGEWINKGLVQEYHRDQVRDLLLRRHRHQFEGLGDHKPSFALRQLSGIGRTLSQGLFNITHLGGEGTGEDGEEEKKRRQSEHRMNKVLSATSMASSDESGAVLSRNASRGNLNFSRKLPLDAESATILVGEVEFVLRPVCAVIRIGNNVCLGNLTEVNIPTRFIFLLLGPVGNAAKYHEIGRAMGAVCSDPIFQQHLYAARSRKDLTDALDEFMNEATLLPPGEWDPQIRIEPPKKLPAQADRKRSLAESSAASPIVEEKEVEQKEEVQVERTGRLFGGLVGDIKRKSRYYISDFRDGLSLQCLAAVVFLYFATLTPVVAFGAVLGVHTGNNMAAMESILSAAVVGILWAFFAGQPLTIMGSTGPVLVFEAIVTTTCSTYGLEYLPLRFWIGIWTGLFLFIMVATDAAYLVQFITRFTEEGFAALISFIFIFEAIQKLFAVRKKRNVCVWPLNCPQLYEDCHCNISSNPSVFPDAQQPTSDLNSYSIAEMESGPAQLLSNVTRGECSAQGGVLTGPGCSYTPDVFFFSIILFCGTYFLSYMLKGFRNEPYFPNRVRVIVSDFGVTAAIIAMTLLDFYLGLDTPKLQVPSGLTPTIPDRSWIVHPFGTNPWWTSLAAIIPALFAVILIFMDQEITAVIVNRSENKLKKGYGYHLDLLVLTISVIFCAIMGLPWMVAATVLSINHVNSLKQESESRAPGEAPQFVSVRENRLTTLCIYLLVGASVFMTPLLSRIPMPVLYGVFLFMGVSALRGLQFVDRLALLFMPLKYQPDYSYVRHVPLKKIHLFTFIQILCLALLWVLKSFDESSILFPLMVLALVGVRRLMDFVFSQRELKLLDDLMPEFTRRKKEDQTKNNQDKTTEPHHNQVHESPSANHISVALPNGHVMTIPVNHSEHNSKGPEMVNETTVKKSPRWNQSDKKEAQSGRPLLPKLGSSILGKGVPAQIPEEKSPPQSPSPRVSPIPLLPFISVSPATPLQTPRGEAT